MSQTIESYISQGNLIEALGECMRDNKNNLGLLLAKINQNYETNPQFFSILNQLYKNVNGESMNNIEINNIDEKNKILENKEKLIDQKIEFYIKNKNNIENLSINNLEDYEKLQNLINNNDFNFNLNTDLNSTLNLEELKKDMNIINEGIEVLKIDDIDFGENLNTFFNNFNKENKKIDTT